MKFELDFSRVKNHRKPKPLPEIEAVPQEQVSDISEYVSMGDELISMSVSTAVVGLGLAFGIGMLCGYSAGFRVGKVVGQAVGMSASYASIARMAVRI